MIGDYVTDSVFFHGVTVCFDRQIPDITDSEFEPIIIGENMTVRRWVSNGSSNFLDSGVMEKLTRCYTSHCSLLR